MQKIWFLRRALNEGRARLARALPTSYRSHSEGDNTKLCHFGLICATVCCFVINGWCLVLFGIMWSVMINCIFMSGELWLCLWLVELRIQLYVVKVIVCVMLWCVVWSENCWWCVTCMVFYSQIWCCSHWCVIVIVLSYTMYHMLLLLWKRWV